MSSVLIKYFNNLDKNSKIGHAFLIGNVRLETILDDLKDIINKHFIKTKSLLPETLDLYIIKALKNNISKDQIIELQKNLFNTSQFNDSKVYIIDECEKMNTHTANSLLKILEEPPLNVYAFLVTTNIDSILPTIKSRCQNIFISSSDSSSVIKDEMKDEIVKFIKEAEMSKEKSIAYLSAYYKEINDRTYFKDFLYGIVLFYRDVVNSILNNELVWYNSYEKQIANIGKSNNIVEISRKMKDVNEIIMDLDKNININLAIDKLFMSIGGIEL